jgi:hypothetical protein
MRELFIEELAEVRGGAEPLDKLMQWVRENFVTMTTHACGEEGPLQPNPLC